METLNITNAFRRYKSWFSVSGPENDVVLSTRARLARNCSDIPFPSVMSAEQRSGLTSRVTRFFEGRTDKFLRIDLGTFSVLQRRTLLERNLISRHLAENGSGVVFVSGDEKLVITVGEEDHVRIAAFAGGLAPEACLKQATEIDQALDEHCPFAASLQFGYLTSQVSQCGTGLRLSAMLHLPALTRSGLIGGILKETVPRGIVVKGFRDAHELSLGSLYQLSNQVTLGVTENETVEKLEGTVRQLVHYERRARTELLEHERRETEENVFQAMNLLKDTRSVSDSEAFRHIGWLRLGVALGLTSEFGLDEVTPLFFLIQESHVVQLVGNEGTDVKNDVNEQRAELLRQYLSSVSNSGRNR